MSTLAQNPTTPNETPRKLIIPKYTKYTVQYDLADMQMCPGCMAFPPVAQEALGIVGTTIALQTALRESVI